MEEILYELRDHSLGLNCGIWDYCASIISKFGEFLLTNHSQSSLSIHIIPAVVNFKISNCRQQR